MNKAPLEEGRGGGWEESCLKSLLEHRPKHIYKTHTLFMQFIWIWIFQFCLEKDILIEAQINMFSDEIPLFFSHFVPRFTPGVCSAIRPFLPFFSVFVTALCVGSPLAININSILSPFGMVVLLLVVGFHTSAFISGYVLAGLAFHRAPNRAALRRTMSFETG